jgi:hypothetical protein
MTDATRIAELAQRIQAQSRRLAELEPEYDALVAGLKANRAELAQLQPARDADGRTLVDVHTGEPTVPETAAAGVATGAAFDGLEPSRAALDADLASLPGDQDDADYVVRSMRSYYGPVFTDADEATVRAKVPVKQGEPVEPAPPAPSSSEPPAPAPVEPSPAPPASEPAPATEPAIAPQPEPLVPASDPTPHQES